MIEYPDRPAVNIEALDATLRALSLPSYGGVARLLKRRGADGQAVLTDAPYLLVECGALTTEQQSGLDAAIAAHDPAILTPAQQAAREARAAVQAEQAALVQAKADVLSAPTVAADPQLSANLRTLLDRFIPA